MAEPVFKKRRELHNRINRGASPTAMMFKSGSTNVAFEQQTIGIATGYLGGMAPTIRNVVSDDFNEEYLKILNDVLRFNDFGSKYLEMVRETLSTNAHYWYTYLDKKGRIIFSAVNSLDSVCFYDYAIEPMPILFLRRWKEKAIEIVEIITEEKIVKYHKNNNSGDYTFYDEFLLIGGDLPICSFENITDVALVEPILPLIDMYEQIVQNIRSMTEYNDNATLVMTGYSFNTPYLSDDGVNKSHKRIQEELDIATARVLSTDSDGGFNWLIKNVDYTGLLEVLKAIQQLIMFTISSPDTTDTTFSSAESSLALRLKMFPFEQVTTLWKSIYKKQILRLIELITNILNFKKDPKITMSDLIFMSREEKESRGLYDFTNIEVIVNTNVPSDEIKDIEKAVALQNMGLSMTTVLSQIKSIDNIQEEIERMDKQQQDEYLIYANKKKDIERI